ncbi:PHO85 cyclin-1 [Meyerozyma sp. JA9]|nr:PHO85 cyclin-1 [Meyerozyma sp. JA9]
MSALDLKALSIFINTPVSQDMIHKLVVSTLQVLPCGNTLEPIPGKDRPLPSLMTFLTKLVRYTNVYTGTLMATLVLLNRLKTRLPKNPQGMACTRHRILLSCLILSAKFHNDSSPKNVHWAKYTEGLFSVKDINLMERQLLYLLNWNVEVSNDEMISSLDQFLQPIRDDLVRTAKMRKWVQSQRTVPVSSPPSVPAASPIARPGTPVMSRSSSNSSTLSLHTRQVSTTSISSVSSGETSPHYGVDPKIEYAALNEQQKLNRLIQSLT